MDPTLQCTRSNVQRKAILSASSFNASSTEDSHGRGNGLRVVIIE
jgi:hypothetical protein